MKYLFFDNASTTRCCESAAQLIQRFASEDFGNPSSSHVFGQQAAKAIREARLYFGSVFHVNADQILFTGSGSEADNLAIYGVAMAAFTKGLEAQRAKPRVITSAIEHPAVRKTVASLAAFGIDVQFAPVDSNGQVIRERLLELLTPQTVLVSIMQVNNIVGAIQPVEALARAVKERVPGVIFHTDAVQAFGRVAPPVAPSPVDLVSLSAHKIEGPKGVGALVVLNRALLKAGLRPLVWGGEQEGGFRSGTQNAGLIAGFHAAAEQTLKKQTAYNQHTLTLRGRLRERLQELQLLTTAADSPVRWNSPEVGPLGVPHIISLSVPGYPSGPLAKLLEERGCLVSTGSACGSQKTEPDPVLSAMGLPPAVLGSAIRISFSDHNTLEDVEVLARSLDDSIRLMRQLLGGTPGRGR